MGGLLCPPPHELWPLGMAATYTIPDKLKFDEESLRMLSDANIQPGARFSLSNIRAEAPANSTGASRIQCLRALCTIEDVHLQLLTLGETPNPPAAATGKGTTFSLNFNYSTGSQGCQIQFYIYTKTKGRKKGKGAFGDIVERSIFKSPWLPLEAHCKKRNFTSSSVNLPILATQLPTYMHYRKYIHPSIYDVVIIVAKEGFVDGGPGGGVGGGLARMLSSRSIGGGEAAVAKNPDPSAPAKKAPPTKGTMLPSLYYSSVVAPYPATTVEGSGAGGAGGGDHFIYVDKQIYYINMSVASLQAHLESMGRDINQAVDREAGAAGGSAAPLARATAAAAEAAGGGKKKKKHIGKRAKGADGAAAAGVGGEMFSVTPERTQPASSKQGTGANGVVSYAILNNLKEQAEGEAIDGEADAEGDGEGDDDAALEAVGEGAAEAEETAEVVDSRFNILKSVLMGGEDTPTYFKEVPVPPAFSPPPATSPPIIKGVPTTPTPTTSPVPTPVATPTATPAKAPHKSHHHHHHHHVHSPPMFNANTPASPLPTSVTWTIRMEVKEHRYILPSSTAAGGGGERMYLAKAIYDLKYNVSGGGQGAASSALDAKASPTGSPKVAGTKKIITFPSMPYMSKTSAQNTQTPVRGFDEKSASLMMGEDGETGHDLPDFVTKKEGEAGGARKGDTGVLQETGECVVCLVNKRNCIMFPCRHTNTCLSCAQMYIQSSLNETANTIPKCPVCRENIALLVHVV